MSQLNKCQKFMAFWGLFCIEDSHFYPPPPPLKQIWIFGRLFSCNTMGYNVAWNECIIISCALCHGDSFYETSLTPILRREQLMIFISPGDIRGHGNSSEISEFLAGKSPMLFCLFHAVFTMIVQKPNTFFEDLLHPYFCMWKKLHYICNEKIYVGHDNSW